MPKDFVEILNLIINGMKEVVVEFEFHGLTSAIPRPLEILFQVKGYYYSLTDREANEIDRIAPNVSFCVRDLRIKIEEIPQIKIELEKLDAYYYELLRKSYT